MNELEFALSHRTFVISSKTQRSAEYSITVCKTEHVAGS